MIIIVRSIVETIGISLATLYFKLRMLLNGIKVRAFFEKKTSIKSTCVVMIRTIITFANQIFL